MAALYIDTSALGRLLLRESDAPVIREALRDYEQHVSSRLLRLELHRLALKNDLVDSAELLIADVSLLSIDESRLQTAERLLPAGIGSLDSIHLATAVELAEVDRLAAVMTYDRRLAEGARHHGLTVVAPA